MGLTLSSMLPLTWLVSDDSLKEAGQFVEKCLSLMMQNECTDELRKQEKLWVEDTNPGAWHNH